MTRDWCVVAYVDPHEDAAVDEQPLDPREIRWCVRVELRSVFDHIIRERLAGNYWSESGSGVYDMGWGDGGGGNGGGEGNGGG
jgi:hypothetical protein